MPVSAIATPGVYASSSELIALVLLTFKLDGFDDLRVVNNSVDIVSRGNTFEAVGFRINLINQDSERLPSVTLQIDNLDPRIIKYIRGLPDAPRLLMEVVSSADDFQSPEQSIDYLRLVSVGYNALVITGQLVLDNYLGARFTAGDYTPSEFPALFGIAGAGTYSYGNTPRGSATLFDCPAKSSTGISDLSDYRRNSRLYGGTAVTGEGAAQGLRVGRNAGSREWMMSYAIFVPRTEVIIEFDLYLTSMPSGAGERVGVFQTKVVPDPGHITADLGQYADGTRVSVFVTRLGNGNLQVSLATNSSAHGTLNAPFNIGHRTRINMKLTPNAFTMTVDSISAVRTDGSNTLDIALDSDFYYRPTMMAWGFSGAAGETAQDWRGYMSNMLVSSSDTAVAARQFSSHPTSSAVALLLKCNDVTGGTRVTDSGYYGYGDMNITSQRSPSISRSGLTKWDGYLYYELPNDGTEPGPGTCESGQNLNFGMLTGDFCIEAFVAPHDTIIHSGGYTSFTNHGPLLIEGALSQQSWVGIGTSYSTTPVASGDVEGAPADLRDGGIGASSSYLLYGSYGEGVLPFKAVAIGMPSIMTQVFGDFYIHLAMFRQGDTLTVTADGFILQQFNMITRPGISGAQKAYLGTTASNDIIIDGKMDCMRLVKGNSVYGAGEFIPFVDEYPDATALPPGGAEA